MQFRICESTSTRKTLIIAFISCKKLDNCILPSFQKFLFWGIPRFRNFYFEGSLVLGISILRDPSFQEFWDRHETNSFFFGGLTQFFVPFFASRQSLCTWHGYFENTSACFFWLQGPLIQSSAAPQGSPPPTQQIKIQMQISWVGWSTRFKSEDKSL